MVYISKKSIRNFLKTGNLKYYGAFFILLSVIIASVVIVNRRVSKDDSDNSKNNRDALAESETTTEDESILPDTTGKYTLTLNLADNIIRVTDEDDKCVRYMFFSCNEQQSEGTYSGNSESGVRMIWSKTDSGYLRYFTGFGEDISFHSALYSEENNKASIIASSYNTIGKANSNIPGITLQLADAKWIYENCSYNSEVVILYDKSINNDSETIDGLINVTVPNDVGWDPSEINDESVWVRNHLQDITGPDEIEIDCDSSKFLLKGIMAVDENGNDVTDKIYITGEYDRNMAGVYNVVLNVIDIFGKHLTKPYVINITDNNREEQDSTKQEIIETSTTKHEKPTQIYTEPVTIPDETTQIQPTTKYIEESTVEETLTENNITEEITSDVD